MKKSEIKGTLTEYLNGTSIKLNNERVTVIDNVIDNEEVLSIEFIIATTDPNPIASCEHVKGKAMLITMDLSKTSAQALVIAIHNILNR